MPKRVKPETDKKQQDRYYKKHSHNNFNSQKKYTEGECKTILMHSECDWKTAKKMQRTLHAIQLKRVRLLKKEKQNV
jgi:hypothetical protein